MRYVMVIDLKGCIGCHTCAMACRLANNLPDGVWRIKIRESEAAFEHPVSEFAPKSAPVFVPVSCRHCKDAPCVAACSTGAFYRRDDGIVAVDAEKCIGCKACIRACSYDACEYLDKAPEYSTGFAVGDADAAVHMQNTMDKCDFCVGRIDQGKAPACMEHCPGAARWYGDLDDPNSDVSRLLEQREHTSFAKSGTEPSVYYLI